MGWLLPSTSHAMHAEAPKGVIAAKTLNASQAATKKLEEEVLKLEAEVRPLPLGAFKF